MAKFNKEGLFMSVILEYKNVNKCFGEKEVLKNQIHRQIKSEIIMYIIKKYNHEKFI